MIIVAQIIVKNLSLLGSFSNENGATFSHILNKPMIVSLLLFYTHFDSFSQFEDYQWILGYNNSPNPNTMNFNFENEQLNITTRHSSYKVSDGNAIISAPDGKKIIAMSNAYTIYHRELDTMVNGGRINRNTAFYSIYGSSLLQSVLVLNLPGSSSYYKVLYFWEDRPRPDSFVQVNKLYEATIDAQLNQGLGQVLEYDVMVDTDRYDFGKLQACRHANGRDWWVVIPRRYAPQLLVYLLDPSGIRRHHVEALPFDIKTGIGQAQFSPDGTLYALAQSQDNFRQGQYLQLFDFDRCSGTFSNMHSIHFPDTFGGGGLAFSSNSQILYFASTKTIYQFFPKRADVASSKTLVGEYQGMIDSFFSWAPCHIGYLILAPDHKIYITNTTTTYWMHSIEYPDSVGKSCKYWEGRLKLPAPNFSSIPSYPHFRLGPVDGSICDSLDIDNIPLARWRSEVDVADPLTFHFFDLSSYEPTQWSWDFDDPASGSDNGSNLAFPVHRFSSPGVYRVCLTVLNANGSGSQCKEMNLHITSTVQNHSNSIPSIQWQYHAHNHTLSIQDINLLNPVSILITNIHGQRLFHKQHQLLPADILLNDFPQGLYWVHIQQAGLPHLTFQLVIPGE